MSIAKPTSTPHPNLPTPPSHPWRALQPFPASLLGIATCLLGILAENLMKTPNAPREMEAAGQSNAAFWKVSSPCVTHPCPSYSFPPCLLIFFCSSVLKEASVLTNWLINRLLPPCVWPTSWIMLTVTYTLPYHSPPSFPPFLYRKCNPLLLLLQREKQQADILTKGIVEKWKGWSPRRALKARSGSKRRATSHGICLEACGPPVSNRSPWSPGASLFLNLQDALGISRLWVACLERLPDLPTASKGVQEGSWHTFCGSPWPGKLG